MANVGKKEKINIAIILLIMLSTVIYISYNIIYILKYREGRPKDIIYTSSASNNTDYKVYLAENDFIEFNYLPSGFSYPTSLIEYLYINFNYKYRGSSKTVTSYKYSITASVISDFAGDESTNIVTNPVWLKEFILLEDTNGSSNNSTINIDDDINIDLDYYNQLVSNFRQTLNIPISSRLEIKFLINIDGNIESNNQTFNKEHYITMTIPLGVKAFDILMNQNFNNDEIIYDKDRPTVKNAYVLSILLIALAIIIILIGLYLIKKIYNRQKSSERIMLEKILREYSNRIITVSSFIRSTDLEIIDISTFNELLNLSDEILEPIIYWDRKKAGKHLAHFSIIRDKIMYRYIIKYI